MIERSGSRADARSVVLPLGLLFALLVSPCFAAPAQDSDATARKLDACVEQAASTADSSQCYATALAAYDHRMNQAYAALMHALPAQAAHQLQAAQRNWLAFRDAELKSQSALFETRQGTMYVPMEEEEQLSLTRDRARRLESYLHVLAIDGT